MAQSVDIRKLDIYKNCAECVQKLTALTDPAVKFSALDQLTKKGFQHLAFTSLEGLGKDQSLNEYAQNPKTNYGLDSRMSAHSPRLSITVVETIVHNSLALSKQVMESIKPEEKSRLYSFCSNPDTYIKSKTVHALEKFINSNNFRSAPCTDHPMHAIYVEYLNLIPFQHLDSCPCNKHISGQGKASATSSSSSTQPASYSRAAQNPRFQKSYFPFIKYPLAKGETLGICHDPEWDRSPLAFFSDDNETWHAELPLEKEFKYVIIKNGDVRYEGGKNRTLTFEDTLCARNEDERPRF